MNTREELWEDRFWAIRNVFLATQTLCDNNNERARRVAEATLADVTSDYAPQASCARSFRELMKSDPERAWEIFNIADEFVRTRSKSRQKATSQITGIARRRK